MSVGDRPRTAVVHHRSGIGDLVWHVPYLRAIAATSRDGRITLIARPSCRAADILAGESAIEEVIEYDHRPRPGERRRGRHDGWRAQVEFIAELRRRRFERIVIFSSRVRYALLAWLAGIPRRVGFGFSGAQRLLLNQPPYIRPHQGPGSWVYPEATALAIAQGFVSAPQVPRLRLAEAVEADLRRELAALPRPRYALAIGASEAPKRWPIERFAALARTLTERGAGVVVLGGPAEQADAEAIRDAVAPGARQRLCLLTQGSVQRSAAALANCDLCVGNDTGILNVAAAVECRCLGLFGATLPLAHDPLIGAVAGQGMNAIALDRVLAEIDALGASNAGDGGPR